MLRTVLFTVFILGSFTLTSQNVFSDIQNTLSDLTLLTTNYVTPGAQASHFQSAVGWVNNARSLDKFKVDVSLHANVLFIPSGKKSYDIRNSDLKILQLRGSSASATIPSVLGGETTTFFDFTIAGDEQNLQAFEGIDQDVIPHPFLQASIGLWKNTELHIRYAPAIPIEGVSYSIYGAGFKHSISQYWQKEINPTAFQIAFAAAHSRFNLDITVDTFEIDDLDSLLSSLFSANRIDIAASSWLFQFVGSKRSKRFEYFGTIGLSASNYSYQIKGTDGFLIDLLNNQLDVLDSSYTSLRGEVGVNYYWGKWYVSNSLAAGDFINYNASIHYKF